VKREGRGEKRREERGETHSDMSGSSSHRKFAVSVGPLLSIAC